MSVLIEAARNNLQTRAQAQEATRAKTEELSAVHQLYRGMFSDCMSILRKTPDPVPYWRGLGLGPLLFLENLMVKYGGTERRVARIWEGGEGQPISVILTGWPLHRNDPYANLKVEGLNETLRMFRNPQTKEIRGHITQEGGKNWVQRDESAVSLAEIQQWRELVDFLKEQQETQ